MKKVSLTYTLLNKITALFFAAALLWLTVSISFTSDPDYKKNLIEWNGDVEDADISSEEDTGSRSANSEEKAPKNTNSISEEIFHEIYLDDVLFTMVTLSHILVNHTTYTAYHGEMDVPPPDFC